MSSSSQLLCVFMITMVIMSMVKPSSTCKYLMCFKDTDCCGAYPECRGSGLKSCRAIGGSRHNCRTAGQPCRNGEECCSETCTSDNASPPTCR